MKQSSLLTVLEVAKDIGVSKDLIMQGLKQDKFPFGTAIKGTHSWRYLIYKSRYEAWKNGTDLKGGGIGDTQRTC